MDVEVMWKDSSRFIIKAGLCPEALRKPKVILKVRYPVKTFFGLPTKGG